MQTNKVKMLKYQTSRFEVFRLDLWQIVMIGNAGAGLAMQSMEGKLSSGHFQLLI